MNKLENMRPLTKEEQKHIEGGVLITLGVLGAVILAAPIIDEMSQGFFDGIFDV